MPKKILAVDDERHIVRLVEVNLQRAGYEVVTAYDGREALEKVKSENPDLVVLDVMMPYMDGFEVLKNLKADPSTADNPMELLTFVKRIFDSLSPGSADSGGGARYKL
jgi:two-component system, OmpR family, alkaline phosphatase synthesis response regulator PhoP